MTSDDREIGRLQADVQTLKDDVHELRGDMKYVRATLSEAKGGWKTVILVAGIAATIGGVVTKVAGILHLK